MTKGDKPWGTSKGREQNHYTSIMQAPLERHQGDGRTASDETTDVLPQGQQRGKKQLHAKMALQCLYVWL